MKRLKKPCAAFLAYGFVFLSHISVNAADLTDNYTWKQMKIGGGGYVVGMHISSTKKNLMYVRADVSGA